MKLWFIFLVLFLGVAVICAFIGDLVDSRNDNDHKTDINQLQIGDKLENIFWFVQITDFHISKFHDKERGPDLASFCREYLGIIKPELVLATGDLVDAKDTNGVGSAQYLEEWQEYQRLVERCNQHHSGHWLDIRGNHDSFDVPDLGSKQNMYRHYSAQGVKHPTSYRYTHNTKFGKYSFISVDACPDPGPKRPFNFFGQLNDDRLVELQRLSQETRDSNLTLWFGHYPTSLIVQDPPSVRHVMRNGIAYVCGHLHTLGGLIPKMYTRHKTGTLELELGDWKDNRIFRIMVVDHDMLSFVDAKLGDWPLVIISNPKHAMFLAETHEPLERIRNSSHIRILIFHQIGLESVTVYIDGHYLGEAKHASGPLYTYKWSPLSYGTGIHNIRVHIKDKAGGVKDITQPFSVDGSRPGFLLAPRLVLMMNLGTVGKVVFAALVFWYILFLGFLRQCSNIKNFYLEGNNRLKYYINRWLWKLWLTAKSDSIYYPVLGAVLYITFGPWFVGDFLHSHSGLLFVWGLFVKGAFIPGSHTYFYGVFHMVTFHIPLLLYLSHSIDAIYYTDSTLKDFWKRQLSLFQRIFHIHLPFALILIMQVYVTFTEFPRAYGTKALTLGPVRTGSILLLLFLHYKLFKLAHTKKCSGNHYS